MTTPLMGWRQVSVERQGTKSREVNARHDNRPLLATTRLLD